MRSEYMQRYHSCQLPEEEIFAILRVLHLAHGARRHPDVPKLPPEEANQPLMDPIEVDRFLSLGVITQAEAETIKRAKRGDTIHHPTLPQQESLFAL